MIQAREYFTARPPQKQGTPAVWRLFLGLFFAFLARDAQAHKASDSYLTLSMDAPTISGRWDISLRDLEQALHLDSNDDGLLTWGEIRVQRDQIASYAFSRLHINAGRDYGRIQLRDFQFEPHVDGMYCVLFFGIEGVPPGKPVTVDYQLLFECDPTHRGLLRMERDGRSRTAIFSPEAASQQFEVLAPAGWRQFLAFAQEGVWHIWKGYDHILFLLALLLPAVLRWSADGWEVVEDFRPALLNVLKVVTAFTVAHSITLSLATLGMVKLPSRLVESAIAASVVLAALNNLRPVFSRGVWLVAFCFGLIHGFGFASVLMEMGLDRGSLALTLVGFNLGVEAGQLAIVAVFLPLAYGLRRSWFYRRFTFVAGSTCVALVATTWMFERLFDFRLLPF